MYSSENIKNTYTNLGGIVMYISTFNMYYNISHKDQIKCLDLFALL